MQGYLDIGAALSALIAAAFWFVSAYGKLPPMATYWGETPENDPFRKAVKFSIKMNRWAALFSGMSALCVGIKIFFQKIPLALLDILPYINCE